MDDIDRAQHQEEIAREMALRLHATHQDALPATGQCHHCGASVAGACRFCDIDCREDWKKAQNAQRRAGAKA